MTDDQFLEAARGDEVRIGGPTGITYIMHSNEVDYLVAVRTVIIPRSRASEWDLTSKCGGRPTP